MGVEVHRKLISPTLDNITKASRGKIGSEEQHLAVKKGLHYLVDSNPFALLPLHYFFSNKNKLLSTNVGRLKFNGSSLMVGGGWDKDGRTINAFYALGFAGVEVGSALEQPQYGNDKPRQFVIGDGIVFNRLGFNSPGIEKIKKNLQRYSNNGPLIGLSIGKNKNIDNKDAAQTYYNVAKEFANIASYLALDFSSPNTKDLTDLQDKEAASEVASAAKQAVKDAVSKIPVLLKISPDISFKTLFELMRVVDDLNLGGLIATNSTADILIKRKYGRENEMGGVSGDDPDFRLKARKITQFTFRESDGKIPIIGAGAIKDTDTAWERHLDGASALQMVTAIRGEGLMVGSKTNLGLAKRARKEHIQSIKEIIGANTVSSSTRLY